MGEVAAAVQEAELNQPMAEPLAQTAPVADQLAPVETPPVTPSTEQSPPPDAASPAEPQPEQSASTGSPMDMLAKLLRGESARPDGS
jgi:hypothetical protein